VVRDQWSAVELMRNNKVANDPHALCTAVQPSTKFNPS